MSTLQPVINKFVGFYTALDAESVSALPALYHPEAVLSDPFGSHTGLHAIQRYFSHLLENVEQCRFDIDEPIGDGSRFGVSWVMHWSHPRMAGGKALTLPGCSMVVVQGAQVIQQRDYYDAGEMIYAHIPLLGWAIRHIKRRVSA